MAASSNSAGKPLTTRRLSNPLLQSSTKSGLQTSNSLLSTKSLVSSKPLTSSNTTTGTSANRSGNEALAATENVQKQDLATKSSKPELLLKKQGSLRNENLLQGSSLLSNTSLKSGSLTQSSMTKDSSKLGSHVGMTSRSTSLSSTKPVLFSNLRSSSLSGATKTSIFLANIGKSASLSHASSATKPSGVSSTSSGPNRLLQSKQSKTTTIPEAEPKGIEQVDAPVLAVRPITKRTEGAPEYDFSAQRPKSPEEPKFLPPELDLSVQGPAAPMVDTVRYKTTLINAVATSLLSQPDFKTSRDPTRRALMKLGDKIAKFDPEFVLKLALYTRCDLNIRATANFLLALASNTPACRPYLKKYYCSSIRLPSDWIEVAEIYQAFHDSSIKFGSLPTALRKVMATKFKSFDEYQLAKYNKDKSKQKKKKAAKGNPGKTSEKKPVPPKTQPQISIASIATLSDDSEDDSVIHSENETEEEIERLSFTLKQLVRKIHISDPVYYVMCLLGKRYPEDPEGFRRAHLPGMWDQDRAGKRMKLATPETWETQVSTKGNKAKTWEDLIDHNKLPFMAMLRNIRNLILAKVSSKHHQWVMRKLNDERSVVNSRQFPFQFFSAYDVLNELERIAKGEQPQARPPKKGAKGAKKPKKPKELPKIEIGLLNKYKAALDNALKIATCYNVKPIRGSTLILCNVGTNMDKPCTSARGLGKPKTVKEVGILLGLMCKYSCEQCTMVLYGGNNHTEVKLKEGTILDNMEHVKTTANEKGITGLSNIPGKLLTEMLVKKTQIDNFVVLTDAMKLDDQQGQTVVDFLTKYRHLVNPNLLFVSVDLSSGTRGVSSTITPTHPNDIHLAGYSDQILRFIAERGDSGQITYIEHIDKAYSLEAMQTPSLAELEGTKPTLNLEKALLATTQKRWRTARVFISSTFRDMHGERDMLTRFVFPELRARAQSRQINIYEVDLRWGVTEEDARSHRAMEICLTDIARSQYFIGILGQRYGWVQEEYMVPDLPEFDWLKEFPPGRSITEVEMSHAALLDTDKAIGKAFFYFRDPALLDKVPKEFKSVFGSESHEANEKIENLKSQIRFSGLEVYDGYPSQWLGVVDDKPLVGHLEDFGQRVLYNLWNAIQRDYPDEELGHDPMTQANDFHNSFIESRATNFVGRRTLLKKVSELITKEGGKVIAVSGRAGSGKSAFMAALAQQCIEAETPNQVLSHFIGAAPNSSNVATILTRFCHELKRRFRVKYSIPEDFADLAKEWPEFLEESATVLGKGYKLLILIDGLDLIEDKHNGRSMDWLPQKLPEGVTIITSCVDNGVCMTNLRKRNPSPVEVTMGNMEIMDKAEMVRRQLAKHRKALEETAFNNQMKLLLTKKEASNPLYLHLACEELRFFGVYEEVTSFLKRMPPSISSLLQDILARLEIEHTVEIVSTALSMLCLVRNGLLEHELAGVLSMYFNSESSGSKLPSMVMSRLLRSLQTFLQPTGTENSTLLKLAHKDIEKAVRQRYMRGSASSKEKEFHQFLSNYFKTVADPLGNDTYQSNSLRAFSELPYHLMLAGEWATLEKSLCNINFLVAKCKLGSAQQLLEDYTPSASALPPGKARELAKFIQEPRVLLYRSFVSRNLHVLIASPSLALQQAVNEPSSSIIAQSAGEIVNENQQPLLRCLNKKQTTNACAMNMSTQSVATCVAVSPNSQKFVAGFKNCSVKVFELSTGKELHSFVGHAGEINGVCFVGSDSVCSASADRTLSLWDTTRGIRSEVLKGHTRSVSGVAASPSGNVIASVSWDTLIRIWNGKSGKMTCTLKTQGQHNTPINCVAFHPEGQIIAVGGWDSHVKVWDSLNKKRIKVLKGHKTSVQAVAYAPSGRHLVSASLDGEVKVWSHTSGTNVGSLVGHSEPVNSIAYTPNGQYLMTASNDNVVKVWSGSLGKPVKSIGHSEHGVIHCMKFDHSTQTIDVGYHNGYVRRFSIQTGQETYAAKPHTAAVVSIAYHYPLIMSASVDCSVKLWNDTSFPKCLSLEGHSAPVTCAAWDKNGFASASEDQMIIIWPHNIKDYNRPFKALTSPVTPPPASKGKGKKKPAAKSTSTNSIQPVATLHAHTGKISCIAFSCDGMKMVTGSNDKSLIIWDTFTHKQLKVLSACHKDWINSCAFSTTSPDYLVTGSNDFTLKLWDLKTGTAKTTFTGHTSSINDVQFSQGCIVSAAFDGSVKVWSQKGVEITTLYCHKQRVNAVTVNIPSKGDSFDWADEGEDKLKVKLSDISLMTAGDEGTIGVWKPFLPNEVTDLIGHSDRVLCIGSTVNNQVLSTGLEGSIRLWQPELPRDPITVTNSDSRQGHHGEVICCDTMYVSKQTSYLATGGRDGNFIIWQIKTESEKISLNQLYSVTASEGAVTSICLVAFVESSTQGTVVVGKDDGTMVTYQFSSSNYPTSTASVTAGALMGPHPVSKLLLTSDRKNIIAGSWSNQVAAVASNNRVRCRMDSHKGWVMDMVTVEENNTTYVYSIALDQKLSKWELPKPSTTSGLSTTATKFRINFEDEKTWPLALTRIQGLPYLVVSDSSGFVHLWNTSTKTVVMLRKVHQVAINAVGSTANNELITGSDDGTIKVWSVNKDGTIKQLGQYYCQANVRSIDVITQPGKNAGSVIIVGDMLGHVTLIQWKQ